MAADTETQQVTVSTLVLAGAHPALVRETPEEVLERLDGDARWVAPAAWAAFTEVGGRTVHVRRGSVVAVREGRWNVA